MTTGHDPFPQATALPRAARAVLEQCGRPLPIRKSDASYGVPGWALTALELALEGRHVDAHAILRAYGMARQ